VIKSFLKLTIHKFFWFWFLLRSFLIFLRSSMWKHIFWSKWRQFLTIWFIHVYGSNDQLSRESRNMCFFEQSSRQKGKFSVNLDISHQWIHFFGYILGLCDFLFINPDVVSKLSSIWYLCSDSFGHRLDHLWWLSLDSFSNGIEWRIFFPSPSWTNLSQNHQRTDNTSHLLHSFSSHYDCFLVFVLRRISLSPPLNYIIRSHPESTQMTDVIGTQSKNKFQLTWMLTEM
jgi:hypothetical protein